MSPADAPGRPRRLRRWLQGLTGPRRPLHGVVERVGAQAAHVGQRLQGGAVRAVLVGVALGAALVAVGVLVARGRVAPIPTG